MLNLNFVYQDHLINIFNTFVNARSRMSYKLTICWEDMTYFIFIFYYDINLDLLTVGLTKFMILFYFYN